jgi:hypothetical protein
MERLLMTDITADMIERACKAYHLGIYGYPCLITDMQRKGMEAAIREVLQLVEEAQDTDGTAALIAETEEMLFRAQQSGDYASQIGFEAMLEKLRSRAIAEEV